MRKKKVINSEERKDKSILEPYRHADHEIPKTRREFLAQGLMGVAGAVFLPSITDLIFSDGALAAELDCPTPEFVPGIPYLCFDFAGGCNLFGNNFIGNFDGSMDALSGGAARDTDFFRFGLLNEMNPHRKSGMINSDLGIPMHAYSPMLLGMMSVLKDASGEYKKFNGIPVNEGLDGILCAVASSDDTDSNPFNTVHAAAKAAANGRLVQAVGTRGSDSGGNSVYSPHGYTAKNRSIYVRNAAAATDLVSLGEELSGDNYLRTESGGGKERLKALTQKIAKMKRYKLESLKKLDFKRQAEVLLGCSFQNVTQVFNEFSASVLSPTTDDSIIKAFGDPSGSAAAITKLVLDSIAGAGTVALGGYDYHGGTAIRGQTMDFHGGRVIGQAILSAAEKGKSLCMHLYTDGSVGGALGGTPEEVSLTTMADGKIDADSPILLMLQRQIGNSDTMVKNVWESDQGSNGGTVMMVYKHGHNRSTAGRLLKDDKKNQFGHWTPKGVNRRSTVAAGDVSAATRWVISNYLALNGKGKVEAETLFGRDFMSGVEDGIFFKSIVDLAA